MVMGLIRVHSTEPEELSDDKQARSAVAVLSIPEDVEYLQK